jgi:hypothetical protein
MAAAVVALGLGACTLSRGDRELAAGDDVAAARAYERAADALLTTANRAAGAYLRLGVLYARPESALYDPREARRIFQRLRAVYPRTPYAHEAELLLAGLEGAPRVAVADPLPEEEPPPPASASEDELRAALARERGRARQLDSRLASLTSEADRLREEIARLEAELTQLKAIDLAEPPH